MKIKEAIKELPTGLGLNRRGKYDPLRSQIDKLTNGLWLPIECESLDETLKLSSALVYPSQGGHGKYQTSRAGNVVYARKKPIECVIKEKPRRSQLKMEDK